ncbi:MULTISPECIES: NAD(P)/FAD-dependent oxidoreductase [unclassified Pseudofrankia]|uniref:FAD-dependent oxidoreductase n=1 Tax=unclassified Pseudofrankia TaxID=2994372 RepID=UPI0008DAA0A3|nr:MULTISPECIES: FAD-dependent monooxygenase [unclassified Pseudofrankia]MDT3445906.1 FAD-dependent monooxygenase [Pseudofrankia sp. BMG5.37]OHV51363.1 monooxygenase [Pseudofrankia sp. BMG5.36]
MSRIRSAIVIGGGIAGPVAAVALGKAGIEATVYEAYQTTADGVGGTLGIAPNGLDALAAAGLGGIVEPVGTPITTMVMRNGKGRRLASLGSPAGLPSQLLVWRPELYRALHDAAAHHGARVEYGKRLVAIEQRDADPDADTAGGVTAVFADGSRASADILIGADGIRSAVRSLIDPAAPSPRYVGLLGFGARLSAGSVDPGRIDPTGSEMHFVFGKRAFFGYVLAADGSGGWFANLPRATSMTASEARAVGADEWLRVLREAFADDRLRTVDLINRTDPAEFITVGGMEDIPTVPTWHRGRVVLIGDAAHATSPSSGQGASLAIESAVQLARCLRDLPYPEAFATYEGMRRDRVERIIKMAQRTNSDKAAGPVARVLRDLMMPIAMRLMNPESFSWPMRHHIDWSAPVTPAGAPGAAPLVSVASSSA